VTDGGGGSKSKDNFNAEAHLKSGYTGQIPNHGRELESLDFRNIVGGPLVAVIDAQNIGAMTTLSFIRRVAFQQNAIGQALAMAQSISSGNPGDVMGSMASIYIGSPVLVSFMYDKTMPNGELSKMKIEVPFITLIPIPSLLVDEVILEFNATITHNVFENKENVIKGRNNNQSTDYQGRERQMEWHIGIKVEAKQDELPSGIEKILEILDTIVKDTGGALKADNKME